MHQLGASAQELRVLAADEGAQGDHHPRGNGVAPATTQRLHELHGGILRSHELLTALQLYQCVWAAHADPWAGRLSRTHPQATAVERRPHSSGRAARAYHGAALRARSLGCSCPADDSAWLRLRWSISGTSLPRLLKALGLCSRWSERRPGWARPLRLTSTLSGTSGHRPCYPPPAPDLTPMLWPPGTRCGPWWWRSCTGNRKAASWPGCALRRPLPWPAGREMRMGLSASEGVICA